MKWATWRQGLAPRLPIARLIKLIKQAQQLVRRGETQTRDRQQMEQNGGESVRLGARCGACDMDEAEA